VISADVVTMAWRAEAVSPMYKEAKPRLARIAILAASPQTIQALALKTWRRFHHSATAALGRTMASMSAAMDKPEKVAAASGVVPKCHPT
jgi:hypothetical protein